jgi:hypothetical protein
LVVTGGQQVSRRALLGASGATALLLAGCGHSSPRLAKLPSTVRSADVQLLNELLDVEHVVVAAYVAATPLLSGHNRRAAVRFLDQELFHVAMLEQLVRSAHGHPRSGRPSYDLGRPEGEIALLGLLRRVEDRAIKTYLDVLPRLSSVEARQTAVSILAVEAQHVAIIRRNLGLKPVASPLVTGSK